MTAQAFSSAPVAPPPPAVMSRPQAVGIERLPTRRLGNEPRESMNCKSCRKRKVRTKWGKRFGKRLEIRGDRGKKQKEKEKLKEMETAPLLGAKAR